MIRKATYLDSVRIWELVQEAHVISAYKDIPLSPEKSRKIIATVVSSPTQFAWVSERNGIVGGVLLGVVDEWVWSRKKEAHDLFFYVNESNRGSGYFLAKKFMEWASNREDVWIKGMSISSGIGNRARTEKFYDKLGLNCIGGIYLK